MTNELFGLRNSMMIGLVMIAGVTGCASAAPADEPKGETTSHIVSDSPADSPEAAPEAAPEASPSPSQDQCDTLKWLQAVVGTATSTFTCIAEGGELLAACTVGGAITVGAACVASIGTVVYNEVTPSIIPQCSALPENIYNAFGFGCQQQRYDQGRAATADDLDASCKAGTLSGVKSFCGRTAGSENTLYNCVDGQWNTIEVCEHGCQMNTYGDDVCKFF
jgi:hypothetical protein